MALVGLIAVNIIANVYFAPDDTFKNPEEVIQKLKSSSQQAQTSPSPVSSLTPVRADWQTYSSKEFNFSLQYPQNSSLSVQLEGWEDIFPNRAWSVEIADKSDEDKRKGQFPTESITVRLLYNLNPESPHRLEHIYAEPQRGIYFMFQNYPAFKVDWVVSNDLPKRRGAVFLSFTMISSTK